MPGSGMSLSVSVWSHHYSQLNLGDLHRLLKSSLSSLPLSPGEELTMGMGMGAGMGMEGWEPAPGVGLPQCGHAVRWLCFCCTLSLSSSS